VYAARRSALREAFVSAGFAVDHSEAGLYLWLRHPEHDGWAAAEMLAGQCGILVTPGSVYGPAGDRHVRVALTATDERVAAAVKRLAALAVGASRADRFGQNTRNVPPTRFGSQASRRRY
jgi:aspartate/methionine/tyrosine aminotransferase